MKIAPSSSPIEAHYVSYVDYQFDFKPHMMTTTLPLLASNLRISGCENGFEMILDREIAMNFGIAKENRKYVLQAQVANLGAIAGQVSGDIQNGNLQLSVEHLGQQYSGEIQTHCNDLEKCALAAKLNIPDQHPIGKMYKKSYTYIIFIRY